VIRVSQGIQSENLRKLRSGLTVVAAKDKEKKVFKKKYKIPLDFELFSSHAPFLLNSPFTQISYLN
jgi:hypothetical protein